MIRSLAVLLAAASGAITGSIGAQTADATLARATSAYRAATTLRASFEQTLTNPLTGNTSVSRGEILRRSPNLLSIAFASPLTDRIVADGNTLWAYLPSSAPGQVMKMRASSAGALDPLSQLMANPRDRYQTSEGGTATLNGRPAHIVTLTPRQQNDPVARATIWVDDADASVRQFEIVDVNGLTRRVRITRLALNAPVPRSAFRFVAPPNTRVIDQAAMAGGN